MRIFVFTTVFAPSVGGIEKLAETLCREFTKLGHEVILATQTPSLSENQYSFEVVRNPTLAKFIKLLCWCDIHLQANVSLKYFWAKALAPGRMIYRHGNAYQMDDGTLSWNDRIKRLIARTTPGIANSGYTASKLKCSHTIFNAYDDLVFTNFKPWSEREKELVFLGRLVSQKGCDVLIKALAELRKSNLHPQLTIIGDGPDFENLLALTRELKLEQQVDFTGPMEGNKLASSLNKHRFMVVPSTYEEPFGIVALEGLACGCVPIVSKRGGLVDAINGNGYTFSNGNIYELSHVLNTALNNPCTSLLKIRSATSHLKEHTSTATALKYLTVFKNILQ